MAVSIPSHPAPDRRGLAAGSWGRGEGVLRITSRALSQAAALCSNLFYLDVHWTLKNRGKLQPALAVIWDFSEQICSSL